jgi:hypothetical protein
LQGAHDSPEVAGAVLYKLAFEACIQPRNDFAGMQPADPEKPQWYNLLVLTPFGMDNPLLP